MLLGEAPGRPADFVKILDFGISKFHGPEGARTAAGTLLGTPTYMAPEQALAGEAVDGRADIYAVGVILYRALTGKRPFSGKDEVQYLNAVLTEDPTPVGEHRPIPESLGRIVHRAMARDRKDRFATATEMATALRSWLADAPIEPTPATAPPAPPRRVRRVLGWLFALALFAGGVSLALLWRRVVPVLVRLPGRSSGARR